ncbi:Uncharacterised protein [Mycobacteroides abscessus subsp. abscessus]|nr:Uncharacterised protein [Mycobacteroides abscessus subsp. abscessus]
MLKWSVMARRVAMICSLVRKAKNPSAITIAGRSDGIPPSQFGSVIDIPTVCSPGPGGITSSRSVAIPGRSTLYQSTVAGG